MIKTDLFIKALMISALTICCAARARADEPGFQVVVHPANTISIIDQRDLAQVFLKKRTYWPDMKAILVVDLDSESQVRRQFSEQVLERPTSAVRNYWRQLLFSGRDIPPPELKTEQEVLQFISTHEEAIGYVSNGADVHALKTVRIK